ncbi:helix-turn-helix transcriptional regulator [Comamonas testosteroni]|uniref:helix-turn-helix transcriptional regulator n=1 Tax=Comamonas testosteroni TaxID=285 RepID=UPI003919DDAF
MSKDRKKMLGDRLRGYRRKRRMSQTEVAELIGAKRQSISAWENGVTLPSALQIADLAMAYCISAHVLLFGEELKALSFRFPSVASLGQVE